MGVSGVVEHEACLGIAEVEQFSKAVQSGGIDPGRYGKIAKIGDDVVGQFDLGITHAVVEFDCASSAPAAPFDGRPGQVAAYDDP